MKSNVKKLLAIFILIISYIIINLMCGNTALAVTQTTTEDINSIDSNQYPQIKEMLQSLQTEHPNWKFKILYTDIEWTDAIANEYVGHGASPRNLVPANNSNYGGDWICSVCGSDTVYDSGNWYCASEAAIAYMIDARNSLNNTDIFQFLELSYSECNVESLKAMVANSFLSSDSCVNAILEAAQTHDVNPYYIVARIFQEQGRDGSTLSKGEGYNGQYVGVYNVFNIGASGNGKDTVILNGLATAQANGWTTLESSIIGGTQTIAKNYIARGQNTLYLQKFDVDNSDGNLYWHQYMQNILAAQKEGETLRGTFEDMGSIDGEYTFIIPVFKNMPSTAVARPSTTVSNVATNTELVRVNVNSSLYLREQPSKNATKIGSIYKDEIITRLEKATEKVDGTYWDYVMKADGTKGYAARETYESESTYKLYLVPVVDEDTSAETETPDTSDEPEEQPDEEVENQDTTTPNITTGDISGDGKVDSMDMYKVIQYILGNMELNDNEKIAVDLNRDNKIDSMDMYLMIQIIING